MNTGHNGGGGGSYDGRGLTGAGKTSSMTSIPAPQNDTSKLSHSGSDSPGKTQNGRPISTFLGANVRPKRTISFSGISIGQNRLSFSPQAGQSYGRPQNPLSQLALSSGARQARSPTSITATSTTMSSSVPYKSKLSLSSTANNGGSYLRNNITRSVESTTAVTNNVNSNVSDDDDEDDYDSDYEEEKDAIILKLKAEAGRLENELQSLRRNIAVERSKIPGGGAVAIQATPPRMMTAGTQTDTLLVAKPTRPAPQPCTPPPPPPQSSPPPLPQSLPPSLDPQQIRAMEESTGRIKIVFNVPQEFAVKVPPNWKVATEYAEEYPETFTLEDILISYWNHAPISLSGEILFDEFFNFLVSENFAVPYAFALNDKKLALPFFKIFASVDRDIAFLKAIIDEEIRKSKTYKEIFTTNGLLYWAVSAYVQVRGKGFIKKLFDEVFAYLMSKDRNADLGTNALVLKVLTVVSVLKPAFKPLQKIIPDEFVAIGNYIWKTGGMKFSDLKPQFVGGFMFERVVCPVLAAPEKFGLLTSCPPGSEKVQSTLLSALEVASKILVVICNPSAVVPEPAPELQNPEILKVYKSFRTSFKYFVIPNLPYKNGEHTPTELDPAGLLQKERERLLHFIQEAFKEGVVKLQRYIIQRVARGDDQSVGFPGDLLEMFRAYVLTEEAAQDAASSEYSAVLDDSVEESPTPFLNIQGQETLSDREVADHPFTKQFMRQAAMCLHPRYRYHLRVHGTDHYLTEDPEYAQTVLGEWKIVALHRKDAIGRDDDDDKEEEEEEEEEDCSNSNDNSNSVCLRLDFAGEDEYAGDREAAAKIERITGSEYNWSSFNEEAYTFSRMLFRAAPHADRPYPASRLCFADAATADALRVESCTVTIVHPHEATSKTLPITAQTTVRELFETVSRKFRGCSSPAVDTPDKFAMKVCGLELYLFPTDTLPLLRAPRVARAARRGKRITLVIVPADGLVAESPVPIDFVLPHAPAGPATIPSTRDQRPFEIIVASGALPLDAPRCLRVEAAIYYGGRRISSFFATRAEPPAATAAAGGAGAGAGAGTIPYVWNSHMVFDLLVPNLPRESRVCIAVLSVPKSADSDGFTQTTDAEQSPRSLLDANAGTCQSSFSSTITTAAVTASQSISATAVNSGSGSVIVSPPPVASNGLGNGNNGSGIGADRSGSPMATSGNGDDNGSDRVKRKRSLSSGIATGSEVANESGNDGNSSSDSDDEEAGKVRPVYWTSFPVYNYRSVLISGQHSLQLLKGKVNPIGICVHAMNLHENAVLRIDVPSSSTVVYSDEDDEEKDKKSGDAQEKGKQGSPEEVSLEDKAKLDKLIMSDSLYTLTDEDKALIWKHRHYLKSKPQSIIKLLLAAPTTDYHIFNEIHTMLKDWELIDPIRALELLDGKFPDTCTREYAVKCLSKMSVEELDDYMMQLVQALKFETYHNSPLALFMLKAAINNRLPIGHTLFLMLKAEMHIPEVRERFLLLLKCYLRACGKHRDVLARQLDLIDTLMVVNKTKSFQALESFSLGTRFYLPHDPTLCVSRLIPEKCRVLGSARAPLWLAFENADKLAKDPVCVLFKAADDLRQDMLALQVIKLMDRIWEDDGLDMCLTLYKCIALGPAVGMIEVVPNCTTMADIQKLMGGGVTSAFKEKTIAEWLRKKNPDKEAFKNIVVNNFIHSLAGYCVATYLIGVGDRHNDNIMITTDGHFFHIDFGHILGNAEKWKGFKRDRAPFVLTPELVYVMGGRADANFSAFCTLAENAYAAIRKHHYLFITLFTMMLSTDIPELRTEEDIYYLKSAFNTEKDEAGAKEFFKGLITQSLGTKMTRINNAIHIAVHSHINDAHDVNLN